MNQKYENKETNLKMNTKVLTWNKQFGFSYKMSYSKKNQNEMESVFL